MATNTNYTGLPSPWPVGKFPVHQVTPFTYRDGYTYLELLHALRDYVKDQLHPDLQKSLNTLVAEFERQFAESLDKYVEGTERFQQIHDAFMSDVKSNMKALNDEAVSELVLSPHSALGSVLHNVFATNTNLTKLSDDVRLRSVTPQDYGATGDGVTDDTDALHAFFTALSSDPTVERGFIPHGDYLFFSPIDLTSNTKSFHLSGASRDGTRLVYRGTNEAVGLNAPLVGVHTTNVTFANFTVDAGYNVTRAAVHGVYFRNPNNVNFDTIHIRNYFNSGLLLTGSTINEYGNLQVDRVFIDGMNIANNGLNIANLSNILGDANRAINGGMGPNNSPSYGIQLKNNCHNVHLTNSYAHNWKGGITCGSDTTDVGVEEVSLTGTAVECDHGFLIGAGKHSRFDINVVKPNKDAVRFVNYARDNVLKVSLHDLPSNTIPISFGYHNNTVIVEGVTGYTGEHLVHYTSGVTGCNTIIASASAMRDNNLTENPSSLVLDESRSTSNRIVSLDTLGRMNGTTDGETQHLVFGSHERPGETYISMNPTGGYGFVGHGEVHAILNGDFFGPGANDERNLGSGSRRWSNIYAVNGSINTSDERQKTNIQPIDDAVLDAWEDVEYTQFQWVDGDRTHVGVVAQHVQTVFESHGLDAFDYGVLCWDEWDNEDGTTSDMYGVRYDQAMVLEAALQRRLWKRLNG